MHELIIDNVIYEMSDTRKRQLSDSLAITRQRDMTWGVNPNFVFTFTQLKWFLDLTGTE